MPFEPQLVAVMAIVFLSTLTRSAFGFGNAMIAMPLLSLVVSVETAAPLVALVSTIIAAVSIAQDWQDIHFPSAGRLVAASLAGTPLGLVFLRYADERLLKVTLAAVIIGFSVFALSRARLPVLKGDRSAWGFGLCAGVLGGAYNINAPPLVIYGTLRQWSADQFRATLQSYFLPVSLFTLCAQGLAGLWTRPVLHYSAASLPAVLAAIYVGRRASRFFPDRTFLRAVHLLVLATGLLLLVQSWHG